jgi:hypothetical protein
VGITVGGTVLPFAILFLSYRLAAGRLPVLEAGLGRGELFIPSSIMSVEAIWIFRYVTLSGRSIWYPVIIGTCGLASLGGAICFGITAALQSAPRDHVSVTPLELRQLTKIVTVLSGGEFLMALLIGTIGVVLFMLFGGEDGSPHE